MDIDIIYENNSFHIYPPDQNLWKPKTTQLRASTKSNGNILIHIKVYKNMDKSY